MRIASATVGICLLATILKFGGWIFTASVFILNCVALWELKEAFKHSDIEISLMKNIFFAALIQFTAHESNAVMALLVIILAIIILFLDNIVKGRLDGISDCVHTFFVFTYTTIPFMYWIYVRNLPNGLLLTWWIFIIIWASDTGAFFVGHVFGKTKLAENISPNKTIEGSVGGILLCLFASVLYSHVFFPTMVYSHVAALAVSVGITAQIGDLSASIIKRYCNKKDFSNIIPGHGGILDRFDSALFSFPMAYYYISILMKRGGP